MWRCVCLLFFVFFWSNKGLVPITVAARSKAWTVFAHSNAGIVGSNPNQGTDVCICVYSVFVLFCVYVAALRRADPPSKESYRVCMGLRNWKRDQVSTQGCRASIRYVELHSLCFNQWIYISRNVTRPCWGSNRDVTPERGSFFFIWTMRL
jgi:hypothetical protein